MFIKTIIPLAALCGSLNAASFSVSYLLETSIPDNDPVGLSDTRTISAPGIAEITGIELGLTLNDGWLGDLYGFVQHDTGFSVLLNRVGRTAGNSLGSSASAFDVTFVVGGADIHLAPGPFSGSFAPDARETNPSSTLDTDPRTAELDSFLGLPASGDWTLFIADLNPGDITKIESWSLSLTGVPEPATTASWLGLVAIFTLAARRRSRN